MAYVVCTADLSTEAGATAVAVKMAEAVLRDVFWPVVSHTPAAMRAVLFERFLCALCGVVVSELGPQRAKEALDAAKLAVDDFSEDRRRNGH